MKLEGNGLFHVVTVVAAVAVSSIVAEPAHGQACTGNREFSKARMHAGAELGLRPFANGAPAARQPGVHLGFPVGDSRFMSLEASQILYPENPLTGEGDGVESLLGITLGSTLLQRSLGLTLCPLLTFAYHLGPDGVQSIPVTITSHSIATEIRLGGSVGRSFKRQNGHTATPFIGAAYQRQSTQLTAQSPGFKGTSRKGVAVGTVDFGSGFLLNPSLTVRASMRLTFAGGQDADPGHVYALGLIWNFTPCAAVKDDP